VRPIAFAVLRLIASSNFVGCSMGKSLGNQHKVKGTLVNYKAAGITG
jgi:hypothetical protein